jgi:hypothetical protein
MSHVCFEIIPHPRSRGDWLLKPTRGAPFGLWYRDRAHAVSYAEWVAREVESAEIRVYNQDGSQAESRMLRRTSQPADCIPSAGAPPDC